MWIENVVYINFWFLGNLKFQFGHFAQGLINTNVIYLNLRNISIHATASPDRATVDGAQIPTALNRVTIGRRSTFV